MPGQENVRRGGTKQFRRRCTQKSCRVAAGVDDVQIARIQCQQDAMWLDRSRSMDRLAIAVGEVNRTKVYGLVIHGVRMTEMLSGPTG